MLNFMTSKNAEKGAIATRNLSANAYKYYTQTDPLTVYEYSVDVETGVDTFGDPIIVEEERYALDECGFIREGLTFEELNELLETLWEELNERLETLWEELNGDELDA